VKYLSLCQFFLPIMKNVTFINIESFHFGIMLNIESCENNYCKSLNLSKGGRERQWLAKP
jgi:hypothetical protein